MSAATLCAQVCVVGAGAAGLWAAGRAAALGCDVLLLEKTPRTGTKVLASGGTRCNLTTTLAPDDAARLFGERGARFLRPAFRALSPAAVRARFDALGVPTVAAPLEKIFPVSGRARDVRDALERDARAAGVRIVCDAPALSIARAAAGFALEVAPGRSVACARLVLAPGGASYAKCGTSGDGYAWLAALGLELVEPVPALVPLASRAAWVRELAGVSLQDVEVRLVDPDGRVRGRRRRPLLFTHAGVSGPAAMDLSEPVARAAAAAARAGVEPRDHELRLDLFPGVTWEELRARLVAAAGASGAPRVSRVLPEGLPRRVLAAACAQAALADPDPRVNTLERAARHRLVEALKGLALPVHDTLGFDKAEVTAGGLALERVDPRTMEVRGVPGLFAIGEILDVAGPIGGLNFQSAFATAELAARRLAQG